VIIIARGGGSLEDLLPFYSEEVVRAIFESEIPVISAVGHEVDVSFADLAADYRAPTPSAAAEVVSASTGELMQRVSHLTNIFTGAIEQRVENARLLINQFTMENIERNFRIFIQPYLMRFDDAKETLIESFKANVKEARHKLELVTGQLEAGSPYNILKRGYAVVTREKTGKIVTNSQNVKLEEKVNIRLYEGSLTAVIKEKKEP